MSRTGLWLNVPGGRGTTLKSSHSGVERDVSPHPESSALTTAVHRHLAGLSLPREYAQLTQAGLDVPEFDALKSSPTKDEWKLMDKPPSALQGRPEPLLPEREHAH